MDVRISALDYISRRQRSSYQVKEYLIKKGFDENEVDDIIKELSKKRYIDDVEYTFAYIKYALKKHKSLYRIKYELKENGVNNNDIEDGIYSFEVEYGEISKIEYINAEKEAEKVFNSLDLSKLTKDERRKKTDKLARRLNSLGYQASFIGGFIDKFR